jgi:CCR4-NOT transcription complex subunit 7/8
MIQVGITLSDENGNSPPGGGTWQFNFKFDLGYVLIELANRSSDTYAQDSIDMLSNSAGIDFTRSVDHGIDQNEFGELLITSGLVLLEDVTWITFTGYALCRQLMQWLRSRLSSKNDDERSSSISRLGIL